MIEDKPQSFNDQKAHDDAGGFARPGNAPAVTVERVGRQVIERKILDAVTKEDKVCILATQQDLEDIIAGLAYYAVRNMTLSTCHSQECHSRQSRAFRCRDIANDLQRLLIEAFGNTTAVASPQTAAP